MARVTAYEASDGTLHRDRKAYLRHEWNLYAGKKIEELVAREFARKAEMHGVELTLRSPDAVSAFLAEHLNELRDIFNHTFKPGTDEVDAGEEVEGGESECAAPTEEAEAI